MGTIGDGGGQASQPGIEPDWPWRPPDPVPVERSPERAGLIAVLSGVTATILMWVTILYAWRGDSWLWLPNALSAVLFALNTVRCVTRWRRHRQAQPN